MSPREMHEAVMAQMQQEARSRSNFEHAMRHLPSSGQQGCETAAEGHERLCRQFGIKPPARSEPDLTGPDGYPCARKIMAEVERQMRRESRGW